MAPALCVSCNSTHLQSPQHKSLAVTYITSQIVLQGMPAADCHTPVRGQHTPHHTTCKPPAASCQHQGLHRGRSTGSRDTKVTAHRAQAVREKTWRSCKRTALCPPRWAVCSDTKRVTRRRAHQPKTAQDKTPSPRGRTHEPAVLVCCWSAHTTLLLAASALHWCAP